MIPFQTTPDQVLKLAAIALDMCKEIQGNKQFVVDAYELARKDQGVFDLMELWDNTKDFNEREEIVKDIKKSIEDYSHSTESIDPHTLRWAAKYLKGFGESCRALGFNNDFLAAFDRCVLHLNAAAERVERGKPPESTTALAYEEAYRPPIDY